MTLLGAHISVAGGLEKAFDRGESLGCAAIQIFTKNQLQWRSAPLPAGVCERFLRRWSESPIQKVVAHASYLINLAAPGTLGEKSSLSLQDEIERCDSLGITEIVLHPGSAKENPVEEAIRLVSGRLRSVLARTEGKRVRILLETMAGQGAFLGAKLEEIAMLVEGTDWDDRIGICLDTCHLFASGYDFRSPEAYERLIFSVDRLVGLERIGCIHLNDSVHARGRRLDRHSHLGDGEIGLSPFGYFVTDERFSFVPCILETPLEGIGHGGDLALLRKLQGGDE